MLCSWPAHEEMHKKSSLYYESNTIHCENLLCKKPLVPPWLWFEASILCFCQSVIKILCQKETHLDAESQDWIHLKQMNILQCCPTINVRCKALTNQNLSPASIFRGLCSCRALWPQAPNFCPQATRKSQIFHTNHMLGTLNFTGSKYWALFNFPWSTALHSSISRWKLWERDGGMAVRGHSLGCRHITLQLGMALVNVFYYFLFLNITHI